MARDRTNRMQTALLVLLLLLVFNPLTSSFAIQTVGPRDILGAISAIVLLGAFGLAIARQRSRISAGS